ncbi:MAG: RNA methyltransferase [Leptospiraceae bacterium]|nr:RNA methyltransferase [Leptospiraceae bacterium]
MPPGDNSHELTLFLGQYVSDHKRELIEQVITRRTRYITVVLEDIYQPHNASAVLRSCECFGIQDLHIIENENSYKPNPGVAMGAAKWLDLHYHRRATGTSTTEHTRLWLADLRKRGYRIVATSPHQSSHTPGTIPIDQPLALCFGSEEPGLTETVLNAADLSLQLPMYGFTESFNISVSVALSLAPLVERLQQSSFAWQLNETRKAELRLQWYRKIVKRHAALERRFFADLQTPG